ncbi:FadR/GntR family transcriptional regulator [Segnochrobactrum spirostomi]|uniref:FadR family transcriptional regulator n=1 Tax=Segnochrobactrum spirostomi TaxID=2608987 RepID=A0A6A7Y546_9HYPH|nr:FadR/GntR family transcriptional regulator [Segnochrobactrum spirostomi]MQT13298.1 FadR family transcriptional regulator [Segnochrobactrum spirostomi]
MDKRRTRIGQPARSAHGFITQTIGMGILRGDYPVGAVLPPEAELMARFGVSRTALREAMKTLSAKGLVQSRAKVGTRVLPESDWNMFDGDLLSWRLEVGIDARFLGGLFEVRQTLEPLAAALAAHRRSADDLARLWNCQKAMEDPKHDRESFARVDLAFHLAVVEASRNPLMRSIGAVIEAALAMSFTLSTPTDDPERQQRSAAKHAAIVEAIERGDATAASLAMSAVILEGAQRRGYGGTEAPIAMIEARAFDL